jgi:tetratricopeptide (TPR) repeat protein
MLQVAQAADPDPWRVRLREALARRDHAALLGLAASEQSFRLLPATLRCLVHALRNQGEPGRALALLREVQRRHPDDFWINEDLGLLLSSSVPPQLEAAIRFYTAALAIRPRSRGALINLGNALRDNGRLDEAIAEYHEAIAIDPNYALAYANLGRALHHKGDTDGAIAKYQTAILLNQNCAHAHNNLALALRSKGDGNAAIAAFRKAIGIKNSDFGPHFNLGVTLRARGDVDEAIAEFRTSIKLNKDFAAAHFNLGSALYAKGDCDGAVASLRAATRLRDDYGDAYNNLGSALDMTGDADGAIAAFRKAVQLKPDSAEALFNLGFSLRDKGQLAAALTYLRRGHALASKTPRRSYPSAQWVKECERLVELEPKLPVILSGKEAPANAAERADYARLCHKKHLYSSAARLYREAVTANPSLASAPNGLRYDAACAAAQAARGAGQDAAGFSASERTGLRRQALDWLRADLGAWRRLLDKNPNKARRAVAQKMQHWLRDPDFKSVRGPDALGQLPEAERQQWQQLWADVATMLRRTADKPTPKGG